MSNSGVGSPHSDHWSEDLECGPGETAEFYEWDGLIDWDDEDEDDFFHEWDSEDDMDFLGLARGESFDSEDREDFEITK